jgi:hypothetical protein
MKKTATINLSGKNYAQVKDRIKEFRTDCPNGLIETTPTVSDTQIIFKARILKDKSNPASAEATGHSMGEIGAKDKKGNSIEKIFEKQESIAVGRALALLGYASDGEIASSEEMEEFLADKQEKLAELIFEITSQVGSCDTLEDLTKLWATLSGELRVNQTVVSAFSARKAELK